MSKWKPARLGEWNGLVGELPKIMPDWSPKTFAFVGGVALGALPMALLSADQGTTAAAILVGAAGLDWLLFGAEGTKGELHLQFAAGVVGGAVGTHLARKILGIGNV